MKSPEGISSAGEAVMMAVIRARAIERMITESGTHLFVWRANATEQIEAALKDFGFEVVQIKKARKPRA